MAHTIPATPYEKLTYQCSVLSSHVKVSSLGEYLLYPPVFLFYRISGLNLKGFRTLEKTLNLLYCDTGCVHVDVHISTRYTNPGKGATSDPFSVGITGGLYCFLPLDKTGTVIDNK